MNSMKIGTYQMDTTFGLYLPEYTIPAPAVQTNFVKIIGRDGSVDLSNALGLHYDSRTWSLDFKCFDPTVNWHTLSSQVMNAIHGKRLNFEFDDDPNYFWTGRVSVQNYVSNHGTGTLKVTIVSDPFKYAKLSTIVTKTASTGTDYTGALVTFNTANAKINDLSVTMQPIQDLHGYANPWPGGGGKNKLVYPYSDPHGDTLSDGNATYEINSDGTFSLVTSGDASKNVDYYFVGTDSSTYGDAKIPSGTYTVTLDRSGTSGDVRLYVVENGGTVLGYATPSIPATVTIDATKTYRIFIRIGNHANSNATFKPMIRLSSVSDATYEPYSNICPISGLTGLSVYVSPTQDQQDATTYAVDWTSQAGTVYGGTLDVVTGVLTVGWVCVNVPKNQDFLTSGGHPYYRFRINDLNSEGYYRSFICSHFVKPVGYIGGFPENGGITNQYYNYNNIMMRNDALQSLSEWNAWLTEQENAGTPVQFCHKLATPLTYQLTPQEVEALVGTNNVWSDGGNVTVAVVTPETLTNNGRAVVPTLTASADMVLKWGNYSASVQQGTSTIPQLILENGANLIYIIGTGSISFTWQEASL